MINFFTYGQTRYNEYFWIDDHICGIVLAAYGLLQYIFRRSDKYNYL